MCGYDKSLLCGVAIQEDAPQPRARPRAGGVRRCAVLLAVPAVAMLALAVGADGGPAKNGTTATSRPSDAKPLAARVQSLDKVAEEKSPWGSLRWLINAKLDPPSGITLGVVEINAGQSNPMHVHGNCEEVIYVVSGTCEHQVGKETVVLKAGDALRIPAGVPHRAKALGKEPVRSVVVYNSGERQFAVVPDKSAE